jgi:SAM-dependent methyltransferase
MGDTPREARDWDTYWRGTREPEAFGMGGPQRAVLEQFWTGLFSATCPTKTHPRLLDLACGKGAVCRFAFDVARLLAHPSPAAHGLDYSFAAVAELRRNFPSISVVCGDAGRTPFGDASFDVVASQFGLEYAGPSAFREAARLVARNGVLAAILHLKNGGIFKECTLNLEVVGELRRCRVLELTSVAFRAGFALRDGRGGAQDFQQASATMTPAIKHMDVLMRRHGRNVCGGTVHGLYRDIAHMYRRLAAYDAKDVLDWIERMDRELKTYAGRMSLMLGAAIDEVAFSRLIEEAKSHGLAVQVGEPLHMGEGRAPAAWALVCRAS